MSEFNEMSKDQDEVVGTVIDIEEFLLSGGGIDEYYCYKDLQQRKLFLNESITPDSVSGIVKHILRFNHEDKEVPVESRAPIVLYISSDGGCVEAGFELIDVILNSKTPIYTVNLSGQYSMGFLIGLAGHKRYASQNATFLMHDGSTCIANSSMKAQDYMKFQTRMEDRVKAYVLSRSNLTSEEYDSNTRVEWYMFADEAKSKGFVDYIIGKDCEMDEIV